MTSRRGNSLRERQFAFREREIVRTAEALISERGCRAMTMDQVASHLGISKATLYSHFASKEALVRTVLESSAHSIYEGAREALSTCEAGEDRLRTLCRYLLERLLLLRPEAGELTCCCLAEVACPYESWDRVEALLAENGAADEGPASLGQILRALAALVAHRRRSEGREATREDVESILRHLLPDG